MKNKYSFYIIATLSVSLILYSCFTATTEQQILQRLDELRSIAEVNEPIHPLEQAATARRLVNYFTDPASFDFRGAGYSKVHELTRKELIQHIARGRAKMQSLEINLADPQAAVKQQTATVELTASALGSVSSVEGQFLEIHRIRILLHKVDGSWLIQSVVHLQNKRG